MTKRVIKVGVLGATAVATALIAQTLLNKTSYKVEGSRRNTFVTTENQMIRLASINAPGWKTARDRKLKSPRKINLKQRNLSKSHIQRQCKRPDGAVRYGLLHPKEE